jgi:hypothetical protein
MFPIKTVALVLLAGTTAAQSWQPTDPMLALPKAPIFGDAKLNCTYLDRVTDIAMHACMTEACGPAFLIFMQPGWTGAFDAGEAILGTAGILDAAGIGMAESALPALTDLPMNFQVEFYGLYASPDGLRLTPPDAMLLNPTPVETLDFDWAPDGTPLPAGIPVDEVWAERGVHISADNAVVGHPDLAILFDSSAPTGGDFDLATPGYGWLNDIAYGKLLIIAENQWGLNRFGYVLDPDDEEGGGTIFFKFDYPVALDRLTLIDVDPIETAHFRAMRGAELVVEDAWPGKTDNARMTIGFGAEPVTELEVRFTGSGGIAELNLTPCPVRVNYDLATYGVPLGLKLGEILTDQFEGNLGFRISAESHVPGTNMAAVFDTANPTGGDFDLITPGYGVGNDKPLGKVMIVAENAIDADFDGYIDDPGDDANGGKLVFEFDYDVYFESATVMDIEDYQFSQFEVYDAADALLGVVPLAALGDNSVQTVYPEWPGVRKVVLDFGGSGALADILFCRELGEIPVF